MMEKKGGALYMQRWAWKNELELKIKSVQTNRNAPKGKKGGAITK